MLYSPSRGSGIVFGASLPRQITEVVNLSGSGFKSPDHFLDVCILFLELAFHDPQIVLNTQLELHLYYLADSLAHRNPGSTALNNLAQALIDRVASMRSVEQLDTLTEAKALLELLEKETPDWRRDLPDLRISEIRPTYVNQIYRVQIDVLDSYDLLMTTKIFHYDDTQGFWLTEVPRLDPVRGRFEIQ
jgi:hypothetical protein